MTTTCMSIDRPQRDNVKLKKCPIHGRDSAEGGSLSATRNCKTVSDSTTVTPKATFSPESTGSIYDTHTGSCHQHLSPW